jgi:hypothetical protein
LLLKVSLISFLNNFCIKRDRFDHFQQCIQPKPITVKRKDLKEVQEKVLASLKPTSLIEQLRKKASSNKK